MAYFQKNNNEDQQDQDVSSGNVGGNTYSTSSSEVSSTVESNNENNKKSDTGSGNFVNLNKYLDSNQGKMGSYANSFVEDDLNKGKDYQGNIQNAQDRYLSSIKSDNAYTYNPKSDDRVMNNYLTNTALVSDTDKQRAMNILKGYQGDSNWSNTGDQFDYNNLKKDSDNFNKLSGNITDQNYLKTQMSNDLSTGGKNLDSFLLGASNNSRNVLNDASNQFSELASLLDSTSSNLDKERTNVVNKATENSKAYNEAASKKAEELKSKLKSAYNTGYNAYQDKLRRQAENPLVYADDFTNVAGELGELSHNFKAPSNTTIYDTFKDTSKEAKSQLDKELKGIDSRLQALQGIVDNPTDTSLDSEFEFYTRNAPTEADIQQQLNTQNYINNLMIDNFGDLRNVEYTDPKAVQSLREARVLGWIDDNTFINMMSPYVVNTKAPQQSAGKQFWEGIRSGAESVVTAPAKWTRNAIRKIW